MPPADITFRIADALAVSVEYLVTGKEEKGGLYLPSHDHTIRAIIQIIPMLTAKDNEIILELAKILKKQSM
jgi:hypothetical protein